jgi:hypothetical protein
MWELLRQSVQRSLRDDPLQLSIEIFDKTLLRYSRNNFAWFAPWRDKFRRPDMSQMLDDIERATETLDPKPIRVIIIDRHRYTTDLNMS